MRICLMLFILCWSMVASAKDVSCPGAPDNVLLEEGPPTILETSDGQDKSYPDYMEQDIGGDYDEQASQLEWNRLNDDKRFTPIIAHCFMKKGDKTSINIKISSNIKRCILHEHHFVCTSDTIACAGYVGGVMIDVVSDRGGHRILRPTSKAKDGKSQEWRDLTVDPDEKLVANCFPEYIDTRGDYDQMPISSDMKNCRFANRRFICSVNN